MNNLKVSNKFKEMQKRGTCFVLVGLMVLGSSGKVEAKENALEPTTTITLKDVESSILEPVDLSCSTGVNMYIDDDSFTPTDVNGNEVKTFIYNGTTYLPARATSNAFGANISWDGKTKIVYIDTSSVSEVVNNTPNRQDTPLVKTNLSGSKGIKIYVDGELFKPTDVNGNEVETFLINGTTYLPVRAISNVFNIDIEWDNVKKRVYLGNHVEKEKEYETPTEDAEILRVAKEAIDKTGKYANLLEPYKDQALEKVINANEIIEIYSERYVNIMISDIEGKLEEVAQKELNEFNDLDFEFTKKNNDFGLVCDSMNIYNSEVIYHNKIINGDEKIYDDLSLLDLQITADTLEDCYININQKLLEFNQAGLNNYLNKFNNILDQMEFALNNAQVKTLVLN